MTYYGPWITPPTVAVTVVESLTYFTQVQLLNTDYAALCESTYDDGHMTTSSIDNTAQWAVDELGNYFLAQLALDVDTQGVHDSWAPPDPPARAVDVEVDGDSTLAGLHVSLDVAEATGQPSPTQDVHLFLTTNAPADLTYDPLNGGLPGRHFIPGAAINAYTTVFFPTSVTGSASVTLAADVPVAHITAPYPGTGVKAIQFVVGAAEQISHTPPPFVAGHLSGRAWKLVNNATLVFTFQPPNYRWVFNILPPLRQYPRDDALGGAPRQGQTNGSTSIQNSARQGWVNTYR